MPGKKHATKPLKKARKKNARAASPMTLVELIAAFVKDEGTVRQDILFDEKAGLEEYLDPDNVEHVRSYDPDRILCALHKELMLRGLDVYKKGREVMLGEINPPSYPAPQDCAERNACERVAFAPEFEAMIVKMMASSAYQSGGLHPRRIEAETPPKKPITEVAANSETDIVIAGNGFIGTMEVRFVNGPTISPNTQVGTLSCDIDLYQRLNVKVKLAKANWK